MRKAIYPGTFDPITNGHLDILEKAVKMFDEVILAVAEQTGKETIFSTEERKNLCLEATKHLKNVRVIKYDGLSVDVCKKMGVNIIIRGLRAVSDFEYELQIALMNKKMNEYIETVFLIPDAKYLYLSSSMVRSIVKLDGDLNDFIPVNVSKALKKKFVR